MSHILIIEDHTEIASNIQEFLELEWYRVSHARDGEQGIEKALKEDYDLILLDLMLPEVDGISIARKVTQRKNTPIIMMTAKSSLQERLAGFEVWAVDYLVKPFDLSELLARIQVHLRYKDRWTSSSPWLHISWVDINMKKRKFMRDKQEIHLTHKEFLIMEKLIESRDQVVSRSDIIEYLWWWEALFGSDNKLDVYISNIRTKLGKECIRTIKWVWYILGE